MIRVSGSDGSAIGGFASRLRGAVAAEEAEAPRAIAPTVEQLVDQSFIFSRAPTGARWQPRKLPTGSWPLLVKGGHMFDGRRVLKGRGELVMTLPTPAEFHQRGTRYMVKRQILPENRLPPFWQSAIAKAWAAWWQRKIGAAA